MCDGCNQTEAPSNYADAGIKAQAQTKIGGGLKESTLRDRLEAHRNRLSRQLVQVEQALQLIYTNPDAEKIHEVLNRATS
jgi:hypothetical protein